MNYKTLEMDIIKVFQDSKIMSTDACKFTDYFFSNNGYIAGGFARSISTSILLNQDKPKDDVRRYLRHYSGDIDFFFETKQDSLNVQGDLQNQCGGAVREYTHTKAYFGYQFRTYSNEMFQTIVKVSGNPEHVLSTFDIANAKVFIDRQGIHYTDEWLELEKNKILGIDIWDKPNLLWRVHKWLNKHSYQGIRNQDVDKYIDCLYSVAEKVKKKEIIRWDRPVTDCEIQKFVKKFCSHSDISMNDILKASLLLDSYSQMNVLSSLSLRN
jgi:hypothetical protein